MIATGPLIWVSQWRNTNYSDHYKYEWFLAGFIIEINWITACSVYSRKMTTDWIVSPLILHVTAPFRGAGGLIVEALLPPFNFRLEF